MQVIQDIKMAPLRNLLACGKTSIQKRLKSMSMKVEEIEVNQKVNSSCYVFD